MANMSDHVNFTLMVMPNCSYFMGKYLREKLQYQCFNETSLIDEGHWCIEDNASTSTEEEILKRNHWWLRKWDNHYRSSLVNSNTATMTRGVEDSEDSKDTEIMASDKEASRSNKFVSDDDHVEFRKHGKLLNGVPGDDVSLSNESSNIPPSTEGSDSHRVLNVMSSVMLMTMIYFLYASAQNRSTDTLKCENSWKKNKKTLQVNVKDPDRVESEQVDGTENNNKKKRFRGRRGSRRGHRNATAEPMATMNKKQETQNANSPQKDISRGGRKNIRNQDVRRGRGGRGHRGRRRANPPVYASFNKDGGRI